jgi:hypothetical protein
MNENILSIKNILDIIFKTIKKNASYFADSYLLKDVSMIYKWRCNKVVPKSEDITRIVEFTFKESSEAQRRIIRDQIEQLIVDSTLKEEIRYSIINTDSFEEFLKVALDISTAGCEEVRESNESIEPFSIKLDDTDLKKETSESIRKEILSGDGIDGEYSGVMKFDLVLNKKGDIHQPDLNLKNVEISDLRRAGKPKGGLLGDYKRRITVTGIVIIGTIINFFVLFALYSNSNSDLQASRKIVGGKKIALLEDASPTSTPGGLLFAVTESGNTALKVMVTPMPTVMRLSEDKDNVPAKDGSNKSNGEKSVKSIDNPPGKSQDAKNSASANTTINYNDIKDSNITTNVTTNVNNYYGEGGQGESNQYKSPDSILLWENLKTLKADEVAATYVKLAWNKPYNAKDYKKLRIFRKLGKSGSDSVWKLVYTTSLDTEGYTDNSVSPGTQYTYKIFIESTSDDLLPLLSYDLEVMTSLS